MFHDISGHTHRTAVLRRMVDQIDQRVAILHRKSAGSLDYSVTGVLNVSDGVRGFLGASFMWVFFAQMFPIDFWGFRSHAQQQDTTTTTTKATQTLSLPAI